MSTSAEFGRCRSSAILLSSSAIGFSKSRYVVMGGSGLARLPPSVNPPPPALGQRMMVLDQRAHLLGHGLSVDLRRRNVGMAQHQLHAAQVRARLEQVAGEGMA